MSSGDFKLLKKIVLIFSDRFEFKIKSREYLVVFGSFTLVFFSLFL